MDTIVKMIFGSHLYGTNTPESDTDYKGVFMPEWSDILLNRVGKSINESTGTSHSKNSAADVDSEIYTLHYFIKLACEGETVALDMLHAPSDMILTGSAIWDDIVAHREHFYTKNLKAFVGYARKQAAKYGIKGSRLNDAKVVLHFLSGADHDTRLSQIWDILPEGEHIHKLLPDANGVHMYQVCGRKIGETATCEYAASVVQKFHDSYGERARQAAANEGIDWKAVSHAIRAAYQVKSILEHGTILFPLPQADFLKSVKSGELHFANEVGPFLDDLMTELEQLSEKSAYPLKADRGFWDKKLIEYVSDHYRESIW